MTPLIPDLTAPLMALPIFVPNLLNVELIVFQSPLKKAPQPLNTFLIAVQASENFPLNQPATLPNTLVIWFQIPPNQFPALLQMFLTPIQAWLKILLNQLPTTENVLVMPFQTFWKKFTAKPHTAFMAFQAVLNYAATTFIMNFASPSSIAVSDLIIPAKIS